MLADTQEVDFCKTPHLTIEELNNYINKDWFKELHSDTETIQLERERTYINLQKSVTNNEDDFKRIVLYVWYAELSNRIV